MSERVVPLYIGRDNAIGVLGREWRVVQDLARELGIRPRRVGRIALYLASELMSAIESRSAEPAPEQVTTETETDDLESLRRQLGKRRRA